VAFAFLDFLEAFLLEVEPLDLVCDGFEIEDDIIVALIKLFDPVFIPDHFLDLLLSAEFISCFVEQLLYIIHEGPDIFLGDVFLLESLVLLHDEGQILHLFEDVVLEELVVVLKLILHLSESFVVVLLENFSFFVLIRHVGVQVVQKGVDLLLGVALQSREVLLLLVPQVAVEGELVLVLDVPRMGLDRLELRGRGRTFWRKFSEFLIS
jgi:hypothetical protein